MKSSRATLMLMVGLGIVDWTVPRLMADEWDQKTVFSFSGPVEIPGQVLEGGTYVFKLADSQSDRNIVQVFDKDQTHLYGTFLTVPDHHLRPSGKPIITFDERPSGSPEAVKAWFYPGEEFGHDFVYPKPKAVALAKANNTPVPSMPAELTANTTKPTASMADKHVQELRETPLKAQKPTEEEVDIAEISVVQEDAPAPPAALPDTLPTTANMLPLIGLGGLLCLAIAGLMKFVSVRAS